MLLLSGTWCWYRPLIPISFSSDNGNVADHLADKQFNQSSPHFFVIDVMPKMMLVHFWFLDTTIASPCHHAWFVNLSFTLFISLRTIIILLGSWWTSSFELHRKQILMSCNKCISIGGYSVTTTKHRSIVYLCNPCLVQDQSSMCLGSWLGYYAHYLVKAKNHFAVLSTVDVIK